MPELDKLAAQMRQRSIERIELVSDQPMRLLATDGREATGPAMPMQQLQAIIREVAPAHLLSQFSNDGQFQFPYQSPNGLLSISGERNNGRFQVSITPFAPLNNAVAPQPVTPQQNNPQPVSQNGQRPQAVFPSDIAPPKAPPTAPPVLTSEPDTSVEWYYAVDDKRLGPVDYEIITDLAASGQIHRNTLVWRVGMQDWSQAKLTELSALFDKAAKQAATVTEWYYIVGGEVTGPADYDELSMLKAIGSIDIDANTLVWRHGMPDWVPVNQTELANLFPHESQPPPLHQPLITRDRSGNGQHSSALPAELQGFNWGACLLPLFWGIAHNTWVVLWCFAIGAIGVAIGPAASTGTSIVFGIWIGSQANVWAWQNRQWRSIEEFKQVQKVWERWGVGSIFFSLFLLFVWVQTILQ